MLPIMPLMMPATASFGVIGLEFMDSAGAIIIQADNNYGEQKHNILPYWDRILSFDQFCFEIDMNSKADGSSKLQTETICYLWALHVDRRIEPFYLFFV